MAKYIIEIEDVPSMLEDGSAFYKCVDAPWWYISDMHINRLKPYEDAERNTGEWIEDAKSYYMAINKKGGGVNENTPYFADDIACSECLAKFSVIDNESERFRYCPNCGAKMEG